MSFQKFKDKSIHIAGYPKSGTTLLSALFDNHPQLVVLPFELRDLFKKIVSEICYDKKCSKKEKIDCIIRKIDNFKSDEMVGVFLREKYRAGNLNILEINHTCFKNKLIDRLNKSKNDKEFILSIIESYYDVENSNKQDKRAWVEKTPHNYLFFPLLRRWFGEDVILLHIVRDPFDIYSSLKQKVNINLTIDAFCKEWQFAQKLSILAKKNIKNYHIIQYEQLVANPEIIMKKVCNWLQIDFNDLLLQPTKNGKIWLGNSSYDMRYTEVSQGSIGAHKGILTDEEIEEINAILYNFNLFFKIKIWKRVLFFKLMWEHPKIYKFLYKSFSKK
ncbi:sulfotransferase [Candidatus Parcubacteria bacterium]|nr:sulfotransferase [Candidatus Parcubacteria bacterium]